MGARRVGTGRLAGQGWRRLPGGTEVAVGRIRGRGAGGPLRRRERSRGRARDVQGSAVVAFEPVSGPRGAVGRRDRRSRTRGVRRGEGLVCPRDRSARTRDARDGRGESVVRRAPQLDRRTGGISLRRGESAARGRRRQRPDAALASAVRSRSVRDDSSGRLVGRDRARPVRRPRASDRIRRW